QYFYRYAIINLTYFKFNSLLFSICIFDSYNIKRLILIFKFNICIYTEPANFITAVIDENIFLEAIY
ncbi:hypothetical protein BP00DRAFT_331269, partial [Aspergillus indologenus CBS 114.80]